MLLVPRHFFLDAIGLRRFLPQAGTISCAFPVLERHATDHCILPPSSPNSSPCSSNLFHPLPRSVRVPKSSSSCSLACSSSSSFPGYQVRPFDPGVTLLCLLSPSTYYHCKSPLPSSFSCVRCPFGLSVRHFNFRVHCRLTRGLPHASGCVGSSVLPQTPKPPRSC